MSDGRTIALPDPLAGYEDWPDFARSAARYSSPSARETALADVLGVFEPHNPVVTMDGTWLHDGIVITELSWSVGFGPRTHAWLLRPEGPILPLPGVLALHCHGGIKWVGAEQLVDAGIRSTAEALELRNLFYEGLAPASDLARRGYAVLAHDAFLWGSRRFPLEQWGEKVASGMDAFEAKWREAGLRPTESQRYNVAANLHEDSVAKAAGVLGTSLAGMVISDDLVALEVLTRLPGVDGARLGCFGFSGGGGRAAMLSALGTRIRARVVTCMMATFESLMPLYLDQHSWLLNSPGLWRLGEWPEHVAAEAERPMLVQYGAADDLFPIAGMRSADQRLQSLFLASDAYRGSFYASSHVFTREMQAEAWRFFDEALAAGSQT